MNYYVYLHCKPKGDPFYVGKGSGKRCREFTVSRTLRHRNTIAKYGRKNIGVFVFPCESQRQALDDEALWIAQLRLEGWGLVNITNGGDGPSGYIHTEADRRKMSERLKGNKRWVNRIFSEEAIQRITKASTGKKQSAETIAKRVSKTKGQKRSPEFCAAITARMRGRTHSQETRAKLSEIAKKRTFSAETRAKMSVTRTRLNFAMWAAREI